MWHLVKDVAKDHRIDPDFAVQFAQFRMNTYGIRAGRLGDFHISTMDIDKFVTDCKSKKEI